ncbi:MULTISPECIES: formate/nitrite transporter family protein [unclassified Actinomyces]|uniref:formate/nitrite transporter family protein n=1 Tax=unclassified Actinomyces TaxID=2609248 RepID=UPI0020180F2E|nr:MULTISPECIES: formate/nitrite transporter family protein [unclassified Actinomyces]MCL3777831.1 formate/nitrite transporter family protein [Actinomyces sp. AC-20-1]MCL3789667.1 formate/nitrite transporter family protein [Actinomyces sp. 187325]MCL3792276.1 formate/nitrite transporter family protein [Actinomyces sp. 186855]MCL3794968.1 formate/nitrite transporter family protein [Actinomyces sp. 217892]
MLSLTQNIDYHAGYAVTRTGEARRPLPFLVSSMLGGAFIGLADVFMLTAAGPFREAGDPWFSLISGAVFGMGLILCVFAGGELATSAMMVFAVGAVRRTITWARAGGVLLFMLLGNLLGAVVLSLLVHWAGVVEPGTAAGAFVEYAVHHKGVDYSVLEMLTRGILCNILVCLAIWWTTRSTSEGSKIIAMAWCMAAFVTCGFEHVVANMTTFSLGLLEGYEAATLVNAARNLLVVGLGNVVGGAVFVGCAYLVAHKAEEGADEARVEAGLPVAH